MFTEEEEEDAEGWEEEEEVRGSLSIRNPFSFVIRSRKTLQERLAVERHISLKRCYKTVGPRWVQRRRESSGLYKRWQPLYDEICRTVIPRVEFVRGIPYDLDGDHYFDPQIRNVIVLDDLMSTAAKDPRINDLFTEGSHHRNLSVVTLNQNLFFGKDPTQRRNCHYLVLFNNPVDRQPVTTLGRQMYPSRMNFLLQKFDEATVRPYAYLLVDLKPMTPDSLRLRSDVLGTGIEKEKDEEEDVAEEEEEHPDLLACRPCGFVFAHSWG